MKIRVLWAAALWALAAPLLLARPAQASRAAPGAALAALAGGEGGLDGGAPRRELQQSAWAPNATDCSRSVPFCHSCRYQFYRGTTTKAVCLSCEQGYVVKASGRACWCAPGYFLTGDGSCAKCGAGAYCPGAASTASSAARKPCGLYKNTSSDYAVSDRECLVMPGYGWGPLDTSYPCPKGYYNPGWNSRKCNVCPASLTTLGPLATRVQQCIAPAGYYYLGGRALPCAEGFYKETDGNRDCDACPDGFTTQLGTTGATFSGACSVLMPGYEVGASVVYGTTAATKCAPDAYRAGYQNHTGDAIPCTPCPTGMQTLPNVTGSTSKDACLAPPGYGYDSSAVTATICSVGYYNAGWNREPCKLCGTGGITTDGPGASSADACYVPAGYGTVRSNNGTWLDAYLCPLNTYGLPNNTYGLVDVACTKCMEHTSTNTTGSTSDAACVTNPGYGFYAGQVLMCDYGYYSGGNTKNPCTFCGEGYNTTQYQNTEAGLKNATQGADAATDCVIDFGWTQANAADSSKGLKPCLQGSYKDYLGNGSCLLCPNGTTSTVPLAAVALSDCDACRAGFGTASIDLGNPACTICASGTYAIGGVKYGKSCDACPNPAGFTGKMVSRLGISDPQDCVPEFPTDAGNMDNNLVYDIIVFPAGSLTAIAGNDTEADCQQACSSSPRCQYFEFYNYTSPGQRCYHKLASSDIAKVSLSGGANYLLFGVGPGQYAVYLASDASEADGTGVTISSGLSGLAAAIAACDAADACAGVSYRSSGGLGWRTFAGSKVEGAVGKVRAVGETVNSWIAAPEYNLPAWG